MISNGHRGEKTTLTWRKSSYSGSSEGQCVEIAETTGAVHVRDSKTPEAAALTFAPSQFATFLKFASQHGA
ncbi:DUF397 domain-containing protein [Streptomyces sp. NPDC004610]|uniref:DUF397 domain-containing protein n=1 Tax=unclassified Streptomyces TaxID=2593676 RepID=UPI00339E1C90